MSESILPRDDFDPVSYISMVNFISLQPFGSVFGSTHIRDSHSNILNQLLGTISIKEKKNKFISLVLKEFDLIGPANLIPPPSQHLGSGQSR